MPASVIPMGSEFSPAVIDLRKVLQLAQTCEPDRKALHAQIDQTFFANQHPAGTNQTLGDKTLRSLRDPDGVRRRAGRRTTRSSSPRPDSLRGWNHGAPLQGARATCCLHGHGSKPSRASC